MAGKYLKFPALSDKLGGRSRASIFRDMRDRGFPKPISLSANSLIWDEEAVDLYLEKLSKVPYTPKPVAVPKEGKRRGRKAKAQGGRHE